MPVTVHVVDEAVEPDAIEEAIAEFRTLDQVFSPFQPDSAVSRINRHELEVDRAGELVQQAIGLCRMYESATDGYFSAWVGGRFDPSGLVKGWAIDRACSILAGRGCTNYFVDAGGDVQTSGVNEGGSPWRVGVRNPIFRDKFATVIMASGVAVATSGTYEKGAHIVDPHTGNATEALLSLTVVGPDIVEADVLATAAFAAGRRAFELLSRFKDYDAFAIGNDQIATSTPGFERYTARAGAGAA